MNKQLRNFIYNLPIHLKNYIILESNPDLSDNTYALYKTLLEKKVNEKYKLFWFVNNKNLYKDINVKNVYFINFFGNVKFFDKLKSLYINFKAKYIIDCNKFIYKKNVNQKRFHLGHGMPYKLVPEYCNGTGDVDYLLSISEFFDNNLSELHLVEKHKIVDLGFPRNDDLFKKKNINSLFNNFNYKKLILWLPTYRKRTDPNSNLSMINSFQIGLPIIYNIEDLRKINKILVDLNILLVLKPHPAQDISEIKAEKLSNFIIITDNTLKDNDINLYELLGQTDALITDYSSVYYDYLLVDKPIAITIDDFDAYKKVFNFVYDNIFDIIKGVYVDNMDEFVLFLKNVANDIDTAKLQRNQSKKKLHKYQDEDSSKRVYEFLINNMEL